MQDLSQYQRLTLQYVIFASLAATVCSVLVLIGLSLYDDINVLSHPAEQAPQSLTNIDVKSSPKADIIAAIQKYRLLGQLQEKKTPLVAQLPETKLKLTLVGTFIESIKADSSALISENGGRSERFFIDDALPSGAVLKSVTGHHVTLERGGVLEALYFRYKKSDKSGYISKRRQRLAEKQMTPLSVSEAAMNNRLQKLKDKRKKHAKK